MGSADLGNVIVGFGGVFVLGVIGFLVHWFWRPHEDAEPGHENHAIQAGSTHSRGSENLPR